MSLVSDPHSLNMMLNISNRSICQWPRVASEVLSLHTQLAASPESDHLVVTVHPRLCLLCRS